MDNLIVLSHKECWADSNSPSGYATVGGFPFHMQALSQIFDATTLLVPIRPGGLPPGARPLVGNALRVLSLAEPAGRGLRRKLALLTWLPRHLPRMWRAMRAVDAVHAAVPGDIGTIGILLALVQRKPLFVRHCGTWGEPVTVADRLLLRLLEYIAGGRNVVMATGGGAAPPSARNTAIQWIFSTSLTEAEMEEIEPASPWRFGDPLRLVTVGRMTTEKNAAAVIRALPLVRIKHPDVHLDVVGDGEVWEMLHGLAERLSVSDAVTFHGNVSHEDVLRILARAHLFVFPTRVKEGFPKAVLEAMACGLPVVATGVSVIPELVGTAHGYVLEDTDAEAVAEAILALTEDDERLAAMAARARRASRAYTLEAWRDTIADRLQARWGMLRRELGIASVAE